MTIQFGHNDQKNPLYEQAFSANLKQFVADVNGAGGVPVSNFIGLYILWLGLHVAPMELKRHSMEEIHLGRQHANENRLSSRL